MNTDFYAIINEGNNDLFWSNKNGWVDTPTFDLFTREERETLSLPDEGRWVQIAWKGYAQQPPAEARAMEKETDGETLNRLGDDAQKWAQEFRKTAIQLGYSDMDEGWLIGWFANAIEHSSDVRRWRNEAQPVGEVKLHGGLLYGQLDRDLPQGTKIYAHPPPSAPVGVDVGDKDCLTTRARELLADEYRKRGIGTGLVNDAGTATSVAIAAIATALAQQPAADPGACPACNRAWGEHRIGYSASACKMRQPAAVDDAMVERAAKELRDLHREFGDGADLPEKIAIEIAEAMLAAALAAQQGGA